MVLGSFGIDALAVEPPDPAADLLAADYMGLMVRRVCMGVSANITRKWRHCFRMLLKKHGQHEIRLMIKIIDDRLPTCNYTRPEALRVQFGPMLAKAKVRWPHYFVDESLPELPTGGKWQEWAQGFAITWPSGPPTLQAVQTALRFQLYVFRARLTGTNGPGEVSGVGWPTASRWFETMAKQWAGWRGCPCMDTGCVYWRPGCKHDNLLDDIVDPSLAKRLRRAQWKS